MTRNFDDLREKLHGPERAVLDRFLTEERQQIETTIRTEIDIDRQHVELVNFCAYAFTESGPARETGFVFIRVEPFFLMVDKPRFDLVIHNATQNMSILVECKSAISDPMEVIDQITAATKFAQANKERLSKEIGQTVEKTEQVLCTTPQGSARLMDILKQKPDTPIIVWDVDKFHDVLMLLKASEDNQGEIARGRLHGNELMRRLLFNGVRSSGRFMHYLPSSHMCRLLTELVISLNGDIFQRNEDIERRFTLTDLERQIQASLVNLDYDEVAKVASVTLKSGLECGVFTTVEKRDSKDPATWILKVPFDTRGPSNVEKTVLGYYIRHKQDLDAKRRAVEKWESYIDKRPGSLYS